MKTPSPLADRLMTFRVILDAKLNFLVRSAGGVSKMCRLYDFDRFTYYRFKHGVEFSWKMLKRVDDAYALAYERELARIARKANEPERRRLAKLHRQAERDERNRIANEKFQRECERYNKEFGTST